MNPPLQYDYIIAGAGCAGLSLVMHLLQQDVLSGKKILIADKEAKNVNDRTWCFWEKGEGLFEPIVYKKWNDLNFYSAAFSKALTIHPYQYKLIRGIDFYSYCKEKISTYANITWLQAGIEAVFSNSKETGIQAGGKKYTAAFVFNSLPPANPPLQQHTYWLLQHFKGWVIETPQPAFNDATATLMDFRTDQSAGSTFFYVLPFTSARALVEYTVFSKTLLRNDEYNKALQHYITTALGIHSFSVKEEEFGVIPMTGHCFLKRAHNLINIGTAGGQTKGSSGYTFQYIQKHSAALVNSLAVYGHPFHVKKESNRFNFYDRVLLHVLACQAVEGAQIFTHLFKKNRADKVLKFLDNETSLPEELAIIRSLPVLPFSKAALQQLFNYTGL